jgi:hypothetical protein
MPAQLSMDVFLSATGYLGDPQTLKSLYLTSKRVKAAIDAKYPTVTERKIAFDELRFDRLPMTNFRPLGGKYVVREWFEYYGTAAVELLDIHTGESKHRITWMYDEVQIYLKYALWTHNGEEYLEVTGTNFDDYDELFSVVLKLPSDGEPFKVDEDDPVYEKLELASINMTCPTCETFCDNFDLIGGRYYKMEYCEGGEYSRGEFCEPTCDECGGYLLPTMAERFDFEKEYHSYDDI